MGLAVDQAPSTRLTDEHVLPPRLFRERLSQLRVRLEEVGAERAPEYTEPLGGLQRSLKIRIQVAGLWAVPGRHPVPFSVPLTNPWLSVPPHPALPMPWPPLSGPWGPWPTWASHPPPSLSGIYKGFCLDVIRNKYECELQGAKQHLEVTAGCLREKGCTGPSSLLAELLPPLPE